MVDRVRACLKHWRERGVLRSLQGLDGILVWEIDRGRIADQRE